jgi:hypothetical protein
MLLPSSGLEQGYKVDGLYSIQEKAEEIGHGTQEDADALNAL